PAVEIEPDLARIFGCTLDRTPRRSSCMSHRTRGLVLLDIDPMHGEATRFQAMVLISQDYAPSPSRERESADTVMALVDYFFPDWVERRRWMSLALQQARDRYANSTIKLGQTLLTVEFEMPQGYPESTFGLITIEQAVPR
ncbi:MAG TPA: hypothetical protein VG324_09955, partial [Blastocatellia bacterium]|nr:hypothetical protein [Blastocatellia bacterium]